MRNFWLMLVLLVFTTGCVATDLSRPQTNAEAFPMRNQDPTVGLIINNGTAHLNVFIYDEAGRLVEEIFLAGADKQLTINGQSVPRYWARRLDVGHYRVEVYPFYYQTNIVGPLFGKPFRQRMDLPKQQTGLWVDRNPTTHYDRATSRHWGWILRLHGGRIPQNTGLPGVRMNFQGNFDNM